MRTSGVAVAAGCGAVAEGLARSPRTAAQQRELTTRWIDETQATVDVLVEAGCIHPVRDPYEGS